MSVTSPSHFFVHVREGQLSQRISSAQYSTVNYSPRAVHVSLLSCILHNGNSVPFDPHLPIAPTSQPLVTTILLSVSKSLVFVDST